MPQVVALVFEHVDIERSRHNVLSVASPRMAQSPRGGPAKPAGGSEALASPDSGVLIEHGPANAALKLLDNLCMMLTGRLPNPEYPSCSTNH
jgi:hypothetical protein